MISRTRNKLLIFSLLAATFLVTGLHINCVSASEIAPQKVQNSPSKKELVKGSRIPYGIWVDKNKWKMPKTKNNEDSEFEFKRADEDLFAMVIAERIEIPRDSLKEIILENIKFVSNDVKVIEEKVFELNGSEILSLLIEAKVAGINFAYYSHNYCGKEGTVQVITFTSKNLLDEYISEMKDFLNGLTILKE